MKFGALVGLNFYTKKFMGKAQKIYELSMKLVF